MHRLLLLASAALAACGADAGAPPPQPQLGILTPPAAAAPRINGARVFGVRPGSPILLKIPVTGHRPMALRVAGLPAGATFDPATGCVGGACPQAGDYPLAVTASNAAGVATATITLKVGARICLTPPLGWNSWNAFGQNVSDACLRAQADALVASGLAEHGWSYLVIDDCWRTRPTEAEAGMKKPDWIGDPPDMPGPARLVDADGADIPRPNPRFPDMKALADDIHARGLRIGLYSVPSRVSCCWTWGSFGHEAADAAAWAKWGIDLLKYDWCYGDRDYREGDPAARQRAAYGKMGALLRALPRDIVYNVCNYGRHGAASWAGAAGGHYWRTNGDVKANWADILRAIRENLALVDYAGPEKGWNDPDMLVVGPSRLNGFTACTLTPNEQYTHISLWALLPAPLFIGCDLTRLDPLTLSLLTNDEVLEINQDALGRPARPVVHTEAFDIWARPLADGSTAIALFNRGTEPREITADFAALGLSGRQAVRDVWRQRDLGVYDGSFTGRIFGHATRLYRLRAAGAPSPAVAETVARRAREEAARGRGTRGWLAWEAERHAFFPAQDWKRVQAIAATLAPRAEAAGDPGCFRADWDAYARTADGKRRIAEAGTVLDAPVERLDPACYEAYRKTGDRGVYAARGRIERAIALLAYGEALENKGRFLGALAAYLDGVCAEPSWVAPYEGGEADSRKPLHADHYIDLGAARTAVVVATAVSWFRDRLPPATVARARDTLRGRIFGTFLKDSRRRGERTPYLNWWMPDRFNWSAVCHHGCVTAILALEDDPTVRAEAVESAERLMAPCFLDGFLADGYCEEGMGYWNYGFGHFMRLAGHVRHATGGKVDFCRMFPRARLVAGFGARYLLGRQSSPPFADGNGTPDPTLTSLVNQVWPELYAAEAARQGPLTGEFWTDGFRAFGPFRLVPPPRTPAAPLPPRDWFAAADVLIARAEGGRFALAAKGGANGDRHNHNDAGSYVVALDDQILAGDPGNEAYWRRTFSRRRYESAVLNSYAHPVPKVGGALQGTGPAFGARLLDHAFSEAKDVVVYDLAGAYPARVPILRLVRTITFDRAARCVDVVDEAAFAEPTAFETPVIAWTRPETGAGGARFTLRHAGAKRGLDVSLATTGGAWEVSEAFIPNPKRVEPYRIAVAFREPIREGTVRVRYQLPPDAK